MDGDAASVRALVGDDYSLEDIQVDLRITGSVERTVNRILDGVFLSGTFRSLDFQQAELFRQETERKGASVRDVQQDGSSRGWEMNMREELEWQERTRKEEREKELRDERVRDNAENLHRILRVEGAKRGQGKGKGKGKLSDLFDFEPEIVIEGIDDALNESPQEQYHMSSSQSYSSVSSHHHQSTIKRVSNQKSITSSSCYKTFKSSDVVNKCKIIDFEDPVSSSSSFTSKTPKSSVLKSSSKVADEPEVICLDSSSDNEAPSGPSVSNLYASNNNNNINRGNKKHTLLSSPPPTKSYLKSEASKTGGNKAARPWDLDNDDFFAKSDNEENAFYNEYSKFGSSQTTTKTFTHIGSSCANSDTNDGEKPASSVKRKKYLIDSDDFNCSEGETKTVRKTKGKSKRTAEEVEMERLLKEREKRKKEHERVFI
jgi:hypothetical protein